ncbi:hypothetical protein NQ317_018298 [Molorchus minor]|uniref:TROVE domain-containing protein n=1 Tax=Molorchus minor TaxID=1323400 RepID=A0ABQ9J3M6_9CUCU|nr:hypothetical protein NQ317_018298 [Molorchus minor]
MITGDAPVDLLRIVSTVNEDIFIPHRCLIYHVLAFAITSEKIAEKYKSKITETIFTTCKSDKDFFDFIKFVSSFRDLKKKSKLPHTVGKAVRKYYGMKSPMGLAGSYARYNSYHRWTHKDLIKLAHVQSPSHCGNKKDVNIDEDTERALDLIKKCETLRKTTDPKIALPLIFECNATINQIEPALRKSAEVWNATLPNMSLIEILQSLPKLYKLGFLKRDTPTQALINETLTNTEGIEISRIHPIEVFIFMKLFEKGGKYV